ncbi:unnamed protein product [Trichogramma brassicae]|uniref:Uncharacterized protein n=1 Tax=Trichogramma brassicae TaxID=86971 RepID=A0A6H5IQT6_9HYME|nr:unnamed protein product [Trichogramma brassicae]
MCYFNKLRNLSSYKMLVGAELTKFSRKSNLRFVRQFQRYARIKCEICLAQKLEEIPLKSAGLVNQFAKHIKASYDMTIYPAVPPLDKDGKSQGVLQDLIDGRKKQKSPRIRVISGRGEAEADNHVPRGFLFARHRLEYYSSYTVARKSLFPLCAAAGKAQMICND